MNGMTCTDIINIISHCSNCGVKKISIGNMSVEFGLKKNKDYQPVSEFINTRVEDNQPELDFNESKTDNGIDRNLVGDIMEDTLDNLMIANPLEYERLIKEAAKDD